MIHKGTHLQLIIYNHTLIVFLLSFAHSLLPISLLYLPRFWGTFRLTHQLSRYAHEEKYFFLETERGKRGKTAERGRNNLIWCLSAPWRLFTRRLGDEVARGWWSNTFPFVFCRSRFVSLSLRLIQPIGSDAELWARERKVDSIGEWEKSGEIEGGK